MTAARFARALATASLLLFGAAATALAQPVPGDESAPPIAAPPDSVVAPGDSLTAAPLRGVTVPSGAATEPDVPDTLTVPRRAHRDPLEVDRFELGVATVKGPFDLLGTFAYHRFLFEGGPFEHSFHAEFSYGKKDYLKEGAVSVGYLLRPLQSYRTSWRIRPILEAGPAVHLVFQAADIVGFSETAFHTHAYMKTHAYVGAEALITPRWGIVVRGRASVPDHRPLDYAQAAIFLR